MPVPVGPALSFSGEAESLEAGAHDGIESLVHFACELCFDDEKAFDCIQQEYMAAVATAGLLPVHADNRGGKACKRNDKVFKKSDIRAAVKSTHRAERHTGHKTAEEKNNL